MKKGFILSWLLLPVLVLGVFMGATIAAEKPQYGGTLRYLDMSPSINPMTWDNADWVWKHGYDTGFYMEHLMMGDLQKGPRGTNEYAFHHSGWIPSRDPERRAAGKMGGEQKPIENRLPSP